MDKLYIDDDCVVSFFVGEFGWFLQYWQARLRYLKFQEYPNHKFIVMMNQQYHPIVADFVYITIDLPDEFYALKLETDCYEAPTPHSPPGSFTPPNVYADLINYVRSFYNNEKAIEIWTPRGCDNHISQRPQTFCKYSSDLKEDKHPIIVVFPRARDRAANRNVPEFVWKEVVDILQKQFTVVLAGTPSGACLQDYTGDKIVNLINYNEPDKLDQVIHYISNASLTLSSQSGPTHLSLLCDTPSYIIGHEKQRHSVDENRFQTATAFRNITDYRAIDAITILKDVEGFINQLIEKEYFDGSLKRLKKVISDINRPSLRTLIGKKDLVGVEIGANTGVNAINMLKYLDLKKLYLIDPYCLYDGLYGGGCARTEGIAQEWKERAHRDLKPWEDKIVWIENISSKAVHEIKERVDFVYVDGNHLYPYVVQDIEAYSKILKKDGLLCGHDFEFRPTQQAVIDCKPEGVEIKQGLCDQEEGTAYDWWYQKVDSFDQVLKDDMATLNSLVQ